MMLMCVSVRVSGELWVALVCSLPAPLVAQAQRPVYAEKTISISHSLNTLPVVPRVGAAPERNAHG